MVSPADFDEFRSALRALGSKSSLPQSFRVETQLLRHRRRQMGQIYWQVGTIRNTLLISQPPTAGYHITLIFFKKKISLEGVFIRYQYKKDTKRVFLLTFMGAITPLSRLTINSTTPIISKNRGGLCVHLTKIAYFW